MLQLDSQTQTPEFDRLCFDSHSNIIFPIGIYANKQLNEWVDFSSYRTHQHLILDLQTSWVLVALLDV